MYQYNLIYSTSLLHQMLRLEYLLSVINSTCPSGIYSKYQFNPVIIPNKDYFLVENKKEKYVSYNELVNIVSVLEGKDTSAILVFDEYGKCLAKVNELTLTPYLPIRSNVFLNDVFNYCLQVTRKWENTSISYITDDSINYAIHKNIPNLTYDQLEYAANKISVMMDGLIEDISVYIKSLGWNELFIELENDVLCIFDLGDYRIRYYMEKHKRNDY